MEMDDPFTDLQCAMALNSHKQDLKMLEKPKRKRNSSGSSSIDEGDLMHALSSAMDAFPHEERVQLSCLKVMRHILPSSSNQPQILNAFKAGTPVDQQIQQRLLEDESKKVDSDDEESEASDQTPLDYETMVELVLRAMQACPDSTRLHHLSVSILSTLCESQGEEICNAIIDMEGLIRLSETMTFHRHYAAGSLAAKLMMRLTQVWNEEPIEQDNVVDETMTTSEFHIASLDHAETQSSLHSCTASYTSEESTSQET